MLKTRGESMKGKRCVVSGSGNVAQYAAEKVLDLGGVPISFSDSSGYIIDEEGVNREKLAFVMQLKNVKRGRIKEYVDKHSKATYHATESGAKSNPLWGVKCDVALPAATQNEINGLDAQHLVKNGCYCVSEGANMPSTPEAVNVFLESKVLFGPGKAANAGGVAVSGLEMSQNSMRLSWSREEVDAKLHDIMKSIHKASHETAEAYGTPGNYVNGANIAGFLKIADAMLDQGVV
jgi:glutamate dehydrogenase (NADP+)